MKHGSKAKMKRAALLLPIVITACTSIPTDAPIYSKAPDANYGFATLYIYRLGNPESVRTPDIILKEKVVAKLPTGAYTWLHVPIGKYPVKIRWGFMNDTPDLDFDIVVENGQEYFLRVKDEVAINSEEAILSIESGYVLKNMAVQELEACCKYVSPAE